MVLLVKHAYIKEEDGGLDKGRQNKKSIEIDLFGSQTPI